LVFARDFLDGRRPFDFHEQPRDGRLLFRLKLRQAAEFLSKKDYIDNWLSEMNEEFCFWSFARWKETLREIGFQVHENPNDLARGSRAHTNAWIVENRYVEHVAIFDVVGRGLTWPPTNMILVSDKPLR